MNPSDANSPLATLRQLKEMLDAGTLTPAEFEALKQQLVFGAGAAGAPVSSTPAPLAPPEPLVLPEPLAAYVPTEEPITAAPASPEVSSVADTPEWLAPTPPPLPAAEPSTNSYATSSDAAERRNPLTLVFAIGGALVLLGIILYLVMGRPATPDEHLTSTSQTAADSATVAPEVGPQAQQITLPPATPETIRVAPAVPPPAAPVVSRPDSSTIAPAAPAAKVPTAAPTPAVPTKPAASPKPVPASPAPADSAAKTGQP